MSWPPSDVSCDASGSTTSTVPPLLSSYRRSKLELTTTSWDEPYGAASVGATWRTAMPTG